MVKGGDRRFKRREIPLWEDGKGRENNGSRYWNAGKDWFEIAKKFVISF